MHRVHQPYPDVFVRNRIDLRVPGAEERIAGRLRETGLVTVDGLASRTAVLAFATRIINVVPHRDSGPDGLTTICDTRRDAHRAGFAGFSNGPLDPHTERSGTPHPPRLMLLVCGQVAATGGECLLTDGQAVHSDLFTRQRQAGCCPGATPHRLLRRRRRSRHTGVYHPPRSAGVRSPSVRRAGALEPDSPAIPPATAGRSHTPPGAPSLGSRPGLPVG